MYRLLSSVTARAAAARGPAWSGGRRGAHGRPGLPVLGLGWAGGLGLGLGLALGAKLAVGLRSAGPTQSPADPEAAGAELPHEQALSPGSRHTPASPAAKGFSRAIESSRDLLHRIKVRAQRTPGLRLPRKTSRFPTAGPRVDALGVAQVASEVTGRGGDRPFPFGENALSLGYADVENRVPCKPETVMRIASISKSLTMVALAKLWEDGKLDLDLPVQHYVPEFPEKEYEGEKVSVTTRLLISHLSGIRHYEKDMKKVKEEKAYKALKMTKGLMPSDQEKEPKEKGGKNHEKSDSPKAKGEQENEARCRHSKHGRKKNDFEQGELYLKEKFENSIESLRLFKNDPLFFKPGSQFLYSTFGYTLLAAIVERASGYKYLDYMQKIFHDLDMLTTVQEENEPVIYNRASRGRPGSSANGSSSGSGLASVMLLTAKAAQGELSATVAKMAVPGRMHHLKCEGQEFYVYNKKKRLVNTPYVDNSYKWAGGGFLSTVGDLLKFGNAMLYGYQVGLFKNSNENLLPGYLKPETMVMMWTPVPNTEMSWDKEGKYAMAWGVVEKKQTYGSCRKQRHYASHTGGAVGASSVLLVLPEELDPEALNNKVPPRGIIVSIICNMQSVGLNSTALKIALEFDKDRAD
ncbi:Serine beta-lactamase-like protein LACTB, mitochondrial [Microtus ochrogaster]|uniref:Serine beta-lactamase-like protein LACTB, mitochondrial n=1 Tax=Microtus ochrogaster TaxID=79684 RepID=A0A8J6KUQ6_MICOH|nr:Serine beta-lactamase-like protein LACTB, mitochondrial [Microtus ochrogaster]